ncbi:MAG: T9SS type A sorting domain-containing protein [Owenweeksia sp.]
MKSKITFFTTLLSLGWYMVSATNLGVGDLAITSANADSPDNFSFVLLTDISGTTTVYFTERGWDNDANGGGAAPTWVATVDGTITWTYTGSLSAGTEIQITSPGTGGTATIAGTATAAGTTTETDSWSVSSSSDAIIAYTGSGVPNDGSEVTNFIWAVSWNDPFIDDPTATSQSSLPTGLTLGTNALEFAANSGDNIQYDCSVTTPVATLRSAIADNTNYNLDNTTVYLAPECGYLASTSTTWNGATWDNGVPDATTDAIIAGNVAPGSFTCKDLTINSGFALVFGSNQTVTIKGSTITNNGFGAISVDASANLIFDNDGNSIDLVGNTHNYRGLVTVSGTTTLNTNGDLVLTAPSASSFGQITGTGTINGDVTVQAFIDGTDGRYYYLGAPFTDAILSEFNEPGAIMVSANTAQGTAWEWDADNAEWDPAGSGNLANFAVRGRGYAMYTGNNGAHGPFLIDDGDETGVIQVSSATDNASTVSFPLGYNDGQASSSSFVTGTSTNDTEGWNLVSNPYAAIYDWDGQIIPGGMSSAIYRFNGTNYSSYTKGAGTASRYIAPFQGFFVQMTGNIAANLVFDRDNRNPTQTATLAKKSNYTVDGVSLHIEGMSGDVYDDVFVGFDANATASFDNQWDARKLSNKGITPDFYVALGQFNYSICRVPFTAAWSFPLKLDYDQDGDAMTIHADRSQLKSFGQVTLEDRKLNVMHDLTLSDYNFMQDNAFGPDRFILHFGQPSISIEEPKQQAMVYGFADENGLNMELGILHDATVEVFNLSGQLIDSKEKSNGRVTFPIEKSGLYIMKVRAGEFTQSVKVIR